MGEPDGVVAMLRLRELGWRSRRIAAELGVSRTTVREYLAASVWLPFVHQVRSRKLAGHEAWLCERFLQQRGRGAAGTGIREGRRRLPAERAVEPYRQEPEAGATVRFETPPGRQMQIDFGERLIECAHSGDCGQLFRSIAGTGSGRSRAAG